MTPEILDHIHKLFSESQSKFLEVALQNKLLEENVKRLDQQVMQLTAHFGVLINQIRQFEPPSAAPNGV